MSTSMDHDLTLRDPEYQPDRSAPSPPDVHAERMERLMASDWVKEWSERMRAQREAKAGKRGAA